MVTLLDSHIPICEALARLLAPHAEIVLHDLGNDQIHHIANCFSKRRVGDPSLTDIADIDFAASVIGPYAKINWDGRRLKSVSAVIRDGAGTPIGLMCINHDMEAFAGVLDQLTNLLGTPVPMAPATALFSSDWRERINEHIGAFLAARNATLSGLAAEDSQLLITHLETVGIFEIRNATHYIADVLGVSRATLYNRLKLVRAAKNKTKIKETR
jgi:D-arginine utilization repressor